MISNNSKLYLRDSLLNIALYFTTGSIIQTYLAESGCQSSRIGFYAAALNVVNILASALCSFLPDRSRNVKKPLSLCLALYGLLCFLYLPFCFLAGKSDAFVPLLLLGCVQCFILALRNLYEYKLPYEIMKPEEYGGVISADGVIMCVATIITGLAMSAAIGSFDYFLVMAVCFSISGVLMLGGGAVNLSFKLIKNRAESSDGAPNVGDGETKLKTKANGVSLSKLISMPLFRSLIVPNLIRGFATGIVSLAAVYGMSEAGLGSVGASFIPIAANAAFIVGSALFSFLSRKGVDGAKLCCLGSFAMLTLPAMCLFGGKLFLAVYFIVSFGIIIVNDAVPCMVFDLIPYEIAGVYNTWRMILTTAGTALTAYLGGILIGVVPSWIVFAAAALCQLVSALCYLAVYRKYGRREEAGAV